METKPQTETPEPMDAEESKSSETPPKKNPKTAAGSLNPKEKNAFYQAVVDKRGKRRRS